MAFRFSRRHGRTLVQGSDEVIRGNLILGVIFLIGRFTALRVASFSRLEVRFTGSLSSSALPGHLPLTKQDLPRAWIIFISVVVSCIFSRIPKEFGVNQITCLRSMTGT
jgi:hypothetical protein